MCFVPLALFSGSLLRVVDFFVGLSPLLSMSLFPLTELQNNEFLSLGLSGIRLPCTKSEMSLLCFSSRIVLYRNAR